MNGMDVVYQYDGTLEGFLCCVYDSYVSKESPVGFSADEGFLSLYEVRTVATDREHGKRVYQGLVKRSAKAANVLRRAFLTCMEDKELCLYAFVRRVFQEGGGFMRDLSDPVCYPLHRAIRHMNGELEKLRGFVRFSDYNGVLGAVIEPKNRVLPLLRHHFCDRRRSSSLTVPIGRCCCTPRESPASRRWSIWSWRHRMTRRSNTGGCGRPSSRRWPSRSGRIRAVRTPSCPSGTAVS